MEGKRLLVVSALAALPVAAMAAQVPSAVYNGLNYDRTRTHAGPPVRVARPGRYRHSDVRRPERSTNHKPQ
ncbi:hypothetical protein C4901_10185 [Acidiferrobacter sp. SPIII_3]|jgi:hypothetical protein|uniref:hypothetical protein n=1 Tax=Acidiferrobacter sp. SPIII_3 TaxID=1281578 RepID=UPI000D73403A|nr:hypothetical protein [Acidiferrobacter sp. SPIII_3]AWP23649.1 hypothetical protein C4901_10185 [Acidiferrobacter sp. SPIII_3]